MRKEVYTLDIDNYAPEIKALTFPLMRYYAKRIGAEFKVITDRKFPGWPITCEKLQLYELSRNNDWTIFFDADTLVHPELLDVTNLLPRNCCANNLCDPSFIRHSQDKYFLRDGRNIGTCGWSIVASDWTRDIWRPLDDMTIDEALACCWPTMHEAADVGPGSDDDNKPITNKDGTPRLMRKSVVDREHLLDDFIMSRNIAKYGLKYTTLAELWKNVKMENSVFFWHIYTVPEAEKVVKMRRELARWRVPDWILEEQGSSVVVNVTGFSSKGRVSAIQ